MAEAAAFSLASKVLSSIASPAFVAAYEKGLSIWDAKDGLSKLQKTIETIQAVLSDAERNQQDSDTVRNWIVRVTIVLYDAQKLFDEVALGDLRKQQIKRGNHNLIWKKVLVSCSKLNPIISRYSIAKKVKVIRENLDEIYKDISQFDFMISGNEVPTSGIRAGQDPGCFVNANLVIGREDDKQAVLKMLFNESENDIPCPLVIAIVGIGGMGKTTLAQLIYNNDEVTRNFHNKWFACISDTSDERAVLGKILQSVGGGDHNNLSVSQVQTRIMDSVRGQQFFLILDDVWDDHLGRWQNRMSLFNSCAKGSRVIVTTRSVSVARAVNATKDHNLKGLSEEDAWCLFKRLAFAPGYENDQGRISSGKEILKICRGVPLAIQSVGSLLFERNTMAEWKEIQRQGNLENIGNNETMSVIKLSYDHLSSNLKQCFAYCCLFPKDYEFMKHELTSLWIAQGYLKMDNEETAFMHLLRRGFFQEMEKDEDGEVLSCKMHDIMHDLALYVAGKKSSVLTKTKPWSLSSLTLHISVKDCEWEVEQLEVNQLHSFSMISISSVCSMIALDKLCKKFNMLRTLNLKGQGFKHTLPSSIGELTLLRYLDLSFNLFAELPDSMNNLVNLVALNLMGCVRLRALPSELRNLVELRYLNMEQCGSLNLDFCLAGIAELRRLQYLFLSEKSLRVRTRSEFDVLTKLQQFRGDLLISYRCIQEEHKFSWKLPVQVKNLEIEFYRGVRFPDWGFINGTNNYLAHLELSSCEAVKHLPSLQCLHNLRVLKLVRLKRIEFVESEEDHSSSSSPYLPRLQELQLRFLDGLKRWMKAAPTPLTFPLLSHLSISRCPLLELASFPQCQRLQDIDVCSLKVMQGEFPSRVFCPSVSTPPEKLSIGVCNWLISLPVELTMSLRQLNITACDGLQSLQLAPPDLHELVIADCAGLVSLELAGPSLKILTIGECKEFKNLIFDAPLNALQQLTIVDCPTFDIMKLELDWDSMVHLETLKLNPMPPMEDIPLSLLNRQAIGSLSIVTGIL